MVIRGLYFKEKINRNTTPLKEINIILGVIHFINIQDAAYIYPGISIYIYIYLKMFMYIIFTNRSIAPNATM